MLIMTYYDDDDDDDDDGDDDDADDDDDDDDDDEEEEDDDDYDDDDEVPSCCSFDVTTCESSLRMRDGLGLHRKPSLFFCGCSRYVRTWIITVGIITIISIASQAVVSGVPCVPVGPDTFVHTHRGHVRCVEDALARCERSATYASGVGYVRTHVARMPVVSGKYARTSRTHVADVVTRAHVRTYVRIRTYVRTYDTRAHVRTYVRIRTYVYVRAYVRMAKERTYVRTYVRIPALPRVQP